MLHEGGLYFRPEKNMLPEDYELSYMALQTGITLYHVQHVRIENLVVQGFRLDGINFHDGCHDCVLIDVTARGNGRSGVSIGGSSRAVLEHCIIGDNGEAQVRTEGFCEAEIVDCEIVPNTAPEFSVTGGRLYVDGRRLEAPK
jgi:parallel beta-helix repeat protein